MMKSARFPSKRPSVYMAVQGSGLEILKLKNPRNASHPIQVQVFRRDRWLCRWCGCPVIFAPVMKYLADLVRREGYDTTLPYYHRNWRRRDAPLLDRLGAVIDHVEATNGVRAPESVRFTIEVLGTTPVLPERRTRSDSTGSGQPTRCYSVFGERHLPDDYSTHTGFLTVYELSRLPWLGAMILISC
jgi:hypothetical protein